LVRRVLYPVSRTVREAGGTPEVAAGPGITRLPT
jgi:hypothetical protein